MTKLIKKEFVLAMHPTVPMMLALSAMVLIPSYPYVVIFFYISMAIFFTCLSGRENNDITYSLNLPVSKKDIVRARLSFTVILQLLQLLLMIPFVILSRQINTLGNPAGMDANLSLFAVAFLVYGIFNYVFFGSYYKNVSKVGAAFAKSSIILFLIAVLDAVTSYTVPFIRDILDTPDSEYLPQKITFLFAGILIYSILTAVTCHRSIKNFEKQDLN